MPFHRIEAIHHFRRRIATERHQIRRDEVCKGVRVVSEVSERAFTSADAAVVVPPLPHVQLFEPRQTEALTALGPAVVMLDVARQRVGFGTRERLPQRAVRVLQPHLANERGMAGAALGQRKSAGAQRALGGKAPENRQRHVAPRTVDECGGEQGAAVSCRRRGNAVEWPPEVFVTGVGVDILDDAPKTQVDEDGADDFGQAQCAADSAWVCFSAADRPLYVKPVVGERFNLWFDSKPIKDDGGIVFACQYTPS